MNEYNIIIRSDQRDLWFKIESELTTFPVTFENFNYEVKPEGLYELNGIPFRPKKYVILFNANKKEAVTYQGSKTPGRVLKTVNESQALKKGLIAEFKEAIEGKQIFIYLVLILAGILAYMVFTGGIKI